jgi:hypothetical protein
MSWSLLSWNKPRQKQCTNQRNASRKETLVLIATCCHLLDLNFQTIVIIFPLLINPTGSSCLYRTNCETCSNDVWLKMHHRKFSRFTFLLSDRLSQTSFKACEGSSHNIAESYPNKGINQINRAMNEQVVALLALLAKTAPVLVLYTGLNSANPNL